MSQLCRLFIVVGVGALVALTACDSSPTTPTQPVSSNRILGSFVSEPSAAARQTASPHTSYEGINVSVRQDGRITVAVSSNGTFILEDVPVGRVTIIFTRDGVEIGEVDIRGVGSAEEIRVTLELTDNGTVVLVDLQRSLEEDGTSDDESSDDESSDDESSDDESSDDESSDDESSDDSSSDDSSSS